METRIIYGLLVLLGIVVSLVAAAIILSNPPHIDITGQMIILMALTISYRILCAVWFFVKIGQPRQLALLAALHWAVAVVIIVWPAKKFDAHAS